MKTQCPHCQAKLKAPDGATGKKVNCPKCNQPFVISPLIKDNIVEVCSNCSKEIRELEQACVFNGKIVCGECDRKLRNSGNVQLLSSKKPQEDLQTDTKNQVDVNMVLPKTVNYRSQAVTSMILGILGILSWIVNLFIPNNPGDDKVWFGSAFIGFSLGAAALNFGNVARRGLRASSGYQSGWITTTGIFLGIIIVLISFVIFGTFVIQRNNSPVAVFGICFVLCVWGSTIWVGIDSADLMKNIPEEKAKSMFSLVPRAGSWLTGCVWFWILAFPCYLVTRGKYIRFQKQFHHEDTV
jgi:predicted Zn finger-like uncharacterized protein